MKRRFTTKNIATTGILIAAEIILQLIGNQLAIGPVSINLSLIPIALAAILCGPEFGAILGLANGLLVLLAPSTIVFYNVSVIGTIFICLLKTGLGGLIVGVVYNLFKGNNQYVGALVSSLLLPIINSGIFAVGCLTIFSPWLSGVAAAVEADVISTLFLVIIGWNFVFEFAAMVVLTPAIAKTIFVVTKK